MTSSGAVILDGVKKSFRRAGGGRVIALDDFSLDVQPQEFVSVVGPSGCGKSTLLKIIAGLIDHDDGTVTVGGDAAGSGDIGMVFQDPELLPWRSCEGNVLLSAELTPSVSRKNMRQTALDLLKLVGLEAFESSYPHQLSGGMRQRCAVARALLLDPSVLLMDEPFGALDALTRERISMDLQSILAESGSTVVFVTHSISEAVLLGDRVVVMGTDPGRLIDVVDVDLPRPRAHELFEKGETQRIAKRIRVKLDSGDTNKKMVPTGQESGDVSG